MYPHKKNRGGHLIWCEPNEPSDIILSFALLMNETKDTDEEHFLFFVF